ncbi:MAG: MBL fold metallo-hydrolase [Vicinamibacterales bacterium]
MRMRELWILGRGYRAPWLATVLAVVVSVGLDAQVASQAQLPPQPGFLTPEAEAALPLRIESITPNLYRAIRGASVVAVLVTDEGILLVDTISTDFAALLRTELARRFPGKPVKYVVQTHYHWDHSSGGPLFADTATFVAHENMRTNLRLPIAQAPPPGETTDLDGDNRLNRTEAQTATRRNFDSFDKDKDGFLSAEEISANVRWPEVVFKGDRHTLTIGGKPVELVWARNRHTSDTIDVYFPTERVLFAGDYTNLISMCCNFAFDHRPMQTWIASYKVLETLDFDRVFTNHGQMGDKASLVAFRQYLEEIYAAVSEGIKAGRTVEELQRTVRLEKHKDRLGYEQQRAAVIQSAYDSLTKYSR